ncbi:hypothetical protein [Noviherbaspirillum massiliense]|uniref:hypothetical protein n=1 Tax=Noviherbaspirillum massiliense TaxID=1465823 RepID=UPI001C54D3DC|nr:hypothetical protein [Noviherbaspirillum massiliense]
MPGFLLLAGDVGFAFPAASGLAFFRSTGFGDMMMAPESTGAFSPDPGGASGAGDCAHAETMNAKGKAAMKSCGFFISSATN